MNSRTGVDGRGIQHAIEDGPDQQRGHAVRGAHAGHQEHRLLHYVRPYAAPLVLSVVLMACVGAAHGLTALLIGPVFDRVLNPASAETPVLLFTIPLFNHPVYLQDFVPAAIHNVWTMVAFAIVAVFLIKGVCDYFGNYLVNYVGFSAVTDLRQTVFDKVLRQDAQFFEANSTGRVMSSIMNDLEKIQVATSQILADCCARASPCSACCSWFCKRTGGWRW